jgi:hypothetical protein
MPVTVRTKLHYDCLDLRAPDYPEHYEPHRDLDTE